MNSNRSFNTWVGALSLSAAMLLAWPSASIAGPVLTFEFQGEVTEDLVDLGFFGPFGAVAVGDAFSGRFSYELGPTNPDQAPADPALGVYNVLEFVLDQSVLPAFTPERIVIMHDAGEIALEPGSPPGVDRLTVVATAPGSIYAVGVRLILEAPFGTVFSDDSLPASIDLSQFSFNAVRAIQAISLMGVPAQRDAGELTTLTLAPIPPIPEPSTLALTLIAFGGVLARRGCRKDRRRAS